MSLMAPVVEARVTLLPELSHSRRGLNTGQYRPHIVIGPESQRVAVCEGNRMTENYLGVMFVGGPDAMEPGDTADVRMALMYFPEQPYDEVQPGATFTVREGPLIVGYGAIRSRDGILTLVTTRWSISVIGSMTISAPGPSKVVVGWLRLKVFPDTFILRVVTRKSVQTFENIRASKGMLFRRRSS